ncbi:MAG: hypothetical protein H6707_01930 [Deltaproteobacteria bacterium]|nr:hypothetical protein [Deltaproteobacteria bacterium]
MSRHLRLFSSTALALLLCCTTSVWANKRMPRGLKAQLMPRINYELNTNAGGVNVARVSRMDKSLNGTALISENGGVRDARAFILRGKVKGTERGSHIGHFLVTEVQDQQSKAISWKIFPLAKHAGITHISAGKQVKTRGLLAKIDRSLSAGNYIAAQIETKGQTDVSKVVAGFVATDTRRVLIGRDPLQRNPPALGEIMALAENAAKGETTFYVLPGTSDGGQTYHGDVILQQHKPEYVYYGAPATAGQYSQPAYFELSAKNRRQNVPQPLLAQ